jgi:hypothetical protein
MSVALTIHKKGDDPGQGRYVPVATQSTFVAHWVPASQALGLYWVPQFENGIPVSGDDVPAILGELRALQQWLGRAPPVVVDAISERLQRLIEELSLVSKVPDLQEFEIFIG